jgi:hypothetical protein
MDENQREWQKQFWTNFGGWEYLKYSAAFLLWNSVGIAVAVMLHAGAIYALFFIATFVFTRLAITWQPAYLVFRKVIGNDKMPSESMPRASVAVPRERLPWWAYIPSMWFLLLDLVLLFILIRYFSR